MQSVKAGFIENYTASVGGTQSKGAVKNSKGSFEDIITGSLKANKNDAADNSNAAKAVPNKTSYEAPQDVNTSQGNSQVKPDGAASGKADNTNTQGNASQPVDQLQDESVPSMPQEQNVPAELPLMKPEDSINAGIQELLNTIKDSMKQKLGISEDDFNKALEALGLTPLNLLDVNNLKQFLLKVSNNDDMSAFLTNEDLGNSLKELMNVCNTIQEQFPALKEQLPVLNQPAVMTAENKVPQELQTETDTNDVAEPEEKIDITVVRSGKQAENRPSEENKADSQKTGQNLSATELLIHNLAVNTGGDQAIFTDQLTKVQQIREITTQILDAVRINIKPDQTSMELQLNPENLGKINLTVVSKEGVLTAKFVTGTETAKEAIESQLQVFKENLNNQGLKVENVEVTVSYSAFDQKEQGFQGEGGKESQERSGNRAFRGLDEINEPLADTVVEENASLGGLEENTSSVDYTV